LFFFIKYPNDYDNTIVSSKTLEIMENCSYLGNENTTLK
jgi:hypothetical protein